MVLIDEGCKVSWHTPYSQAAAVSVDPFWAPDLLLAFLILYDSQTMYSFGNLPL